MAVKVVNLSFVLFSKLVANGQESAPKTATSHIRETLGASLKNDTTTTNKQLKTEKKVNHFDR